MSRIDEALRRAAGQVPPGTAESATEFPAEPAGADAAALAVEPFPMEIADRLRVRAPSAPPPPTPLAPPAESRPQHEAEERGKPTGSTSIFERIDSRLAEKIVIDANMAASSREQYRRLAAVLHDNAVNNNLRVLMIASAVSSEGKTLTASNLALTFSESYQDSVLLIDADLRRPTLDQIFKIQTTTGLSEGLQSDSKLVLRQVSPRLSVLPAGRPTSDPMAALTSPRMKQLIEEARESFDWVILDTPPLLLLPDAHLLSSLVNGAVLVIRANSTPHELVRRAAEIIGRDRITGVVLNQADESAQPGYDTYYAQGYYLPRTETLERQ